MPGRQYSYQYETSPRKIKPDYSKPRKKTQQYNKQKTKINTKTKEKVSTKTKEKIDTKAKSKKVQNQNKTVVKDTIKKQEDERAKKLLVAKTNVAVFFKSALLFLIIFGMIFMNSQISESYSKIQKLKTEITEIQKENDQLEINIQNSVNLNNIEQAAKELLGMQKLSSKQTFYISLPKKDYVEPRTEKVIIEEEKSTVIENIIEKIKNIF